MTDTVKIISPIDGSVYAERPIIADAALEGVVSRARAAQAEWAKVPVKERAAKALSFLDALVAMNDEMVPELAWQMGRPVALRRREARRRGARALHGGDRRGVARALRAGAARWLPPLCEARAARHRPRHRAVELSVSDRRQLDLPGADRRQRGDPEARGADASRRRALPGGVRQGRAAEGPLPERRASATSRRSC